MLRVISSLWKVSHYKSFWFFFRWINSRCIKNYMEEFTACRLL
jgi:hypothetical protein